MGLFYTNITFKGPTQKQLHSLLEQLKRIAYISPTEGQFTVVYDREIEDQKEGVIKELARIASKEASCAALACLIHDGDIFAYWLFLAGKQIDTYDSAPDYFETSELRRGPRGGNARKICAAFDVPRAEGEIRRIFEKVVESHLAEDWTGDWLAAEDIHRKMAKALGMPIELTGLGYYGVEANLRAGELNRRKFLRSGDLKTI